MLPLCTSTPILTSEIPEIPNFLWQHSTLMNLKIEEKGNWENISCNPHVLLDLHLPCVERHQMYS